MDPFISRQLNDKLYDKRKSGAFEYAVASLPSLLLQQPPGKHGPKLTRCVVGSSG